MTEITDSVFYIQLYPLRFLRYHDNPIVVGLRFFLYKFYVKSMCGYVPMW